MLEPVADSYRPTVAVGPARRRRGGETTSSSSGPSFAPIATRDGRSKPSVIHPRGPSVERQNTAVRAPDGNKEVSNETQAPHSRSRDDARRDTGVPRIRRLRVAPVERRAGQR